MRRTYQNVIVDGKNNGTRMNRISSNFYNEGKWNIFIEPLLPSNCKDLTFIDMGCNAGLFMKKAREMGFKRVVGVELDRRTCEVARKYLGDGYELINKKVDRNFNTTVLDNLPAADVLLMANFHYHIHTPVILNMVSMLRRKVMYLIVVSDSAARTNHYRIRSGVDDTRRLFRYWEEVKYIPHLPANGDVSPRSMYSVLFKTEIVRRHIQEIVNTLSDKMREHYNRIIDDYDRGIRYEFTIPLQVNDRGMLVDGLHRLVTYQKECGRSDILVEVI